MLVEIVAMLAILALLIAFAFPSLPRGTSSTRMDALITNAVTMLRDARGAAISERRDVALLFDSAHRTLRVGQQSIAIPTDVTFAIDIGGNCPADRTRAALLFRADGTNCGGVLRFAKGPRTIRARINWVDGGIDVLPGA